MNSNNSEVYLKQLSNRLNYCYEFLSNKSVSFIMPESEKAWINIAQAITNKEVVCLENYRHSQIETVKELGYVIAQDVETVHMSESINFKNI
jgi:3-phosphoglycerate kinase